ncbi:early transcribed membrane protein [Plasmodium vinckei vinckei]|uniref:Early transcribed membrane protein n=1 Tax=Plasmodium vinckei vinckei TaxID=54757 RepID=A0A449BT70_PLAVN|nr:early transcribed membrane protein [Plasmodium vinckei vinckei]VEV56676.1 early transcribed membrane protein [Plasmodium vinckei vinckei]
MKLTKALYFIAFLLAINVFVPGSNNYVEAKPNPKGGNSLANKIKNNKAALISTILATLALAAAGTTFGVMHLKNKGNSKPKPKVSETKSTPLAGPAKSVAAGPDKNRPSSPSNYPQRAYSPAAH